MFLNFIGLMNRTGAGAGSGSDVTPNAFIFGNIYGDQFAVSSVVTLAGLTAPISIKVIFTGTGECFYYKNGAYTALASGASFSAVSGDMIGIAFNNPGPTGRSGTYTATNDADGGAALGSTPSNYHITFAGGFA